MTLFCHFEITTVFFDTIETLENKTPAETFPKFPSILRVVEISDPDPPITATSVTFWPSYVMQAGRDWWISIRHVDNT